MSTQFNDIQTNQAFRDLLTNTVAELKFCSGVSYRFQNRSFDLKDLVAHVVKKAIGPEGQLRDHHYVTKEITGRLRDLKQKGDNALANRCPFWKFLIFIGQWIAQCFYRCFGKNEKTINIEAEITKLESYSIVDSESNPTASSTPTISSTKIPSIPISTIVTSTPSPVDIGVAPPSLSTTDQPTIAERMAALPFSNSRMVFEFYNTHAKTPEIRSQFCDACVAAYHKEKLSHLFVTIFEIFITVNKQHPEEFKDFFSKNIEFFVEASKKEMYVNHLFSSLSNDCVAILCGWLMLNAAIEEAVAILIRCKQFPMKKEVIDKVIKDYPVSRYSSIHEKIHPIAQIFQYHEFSICSDSSGSKYLLSLLDTDEKFNAFLVSLNTGMDNGKLFPVLRKLVFPQDRHQIDLVMKHMGLNTDQLYANPELPRSFQTDGYKCACLLAYRVALILEKAETNELKFALLSNMIEKYGEEGQEAIGQSDSLREVSNFDLILNLIFSNTDPSLSVLLKTFTSNLIKGKDKDKILCFYNKLVLHMSVKMTPTSYLEACSFKEIRDLSIIAAITDTIYDIHFNQELVLNPNYSRQANLESRHILFNAWIKHLSAKCFLFKEQQAEVLALIKQRPHLIDAIHESVFETLAAVKLPELVNITTPHGVREEIKRQTQEAMDLFFRANFFWPPGIGAIVADSICGSSAGALSAGESPE